MNKIASIVFIFTLLAGCTNSSSDTNEESNGEIPAQTSSLEKAETKIEQKIANTDLQEKLNEMNSLYFSKEDGSSIQVTAFLDPSEAILKVEEKYTDKDKNEYGTRIFYIENGKKYASKERFEEHKDGKAYFVERVSFYDKNEKAINTKIRKAEFEEELDGQVFEPTALVDCSIKRAMDALNEEGEFETLFQGFIDSNNDSYLSVGKTADGFVSALLVQYENTVTRKLRKNQERSIGTKLDLQYQKMVDENGFEFQVLLTVAEAK